MSSTVYNDIAAGIKDAINMVQSSTIFVPVYQGGGFWAVKEIERSTGQSLGIVLDEIETQGSAECWAEEYNKIEGDGE